MGHAKTGSGSSDARILGVTHVCGPGTKSVSDVACNGSVVSNRETTVQPCRVEGGAGEKASAEARKPATTMALRENIVATFDSISTPSKIHIEWMMKAHGWDKEFPDSLRPS